MKKTLIAGSMALLFIAVCFVPASALPVQSNEDALQEATLLETFMEKVEAIAAESTTFNAFAEKLQNLCLSTEFGKHPVIREIIVRILQNLLRERDFVIGGINVGDLLGKLIKKHQPSFFVISFGAYTRLNPRKENSIDRFKERLSLWRYTDAAKLLKGRTLILERHPFGVHQKLQGPQLGLMRGFKGIYLDIESKLTGNSYVFFIGRVSRIRAFDLTPLK